MSLPLLHSPADIIRQLLVDSGQGINVDNVNPNTPWQTFATGEPSSPDNCLTVYNTSWQDDGRSMVDGEEYYHYGAQIRIRSADHPTGFGKAYTIKKYLAENVYLKLVNLEGISYLIHCFAKMNLLELGKSPAITRRYLFTVNLLAPIRRRS